MHLGGSFLDHNLKAWCVGAGYSNSPSAAMDNVELSTLHRMELESTDHSRRRSVAESAANQSGHENNTQAIPLEQLGSQAEFSANIQSLAPIDGGRKAWTFCLCAFLLETIVWGFGFR